MLGRSLSSWCTASLCIISKLWLTSHPRRILVLLETSTPGTSNYSEDADEDTRTRNPSIRDRLLQPLIAICNRIENIQIKIMKLGKRDSSTPIFDRFSWSNTFENQFKICQTPFWTAFGRCNDYGKQKALHVEILVRKLGQVQKVDRDREVDKIAGCKSC